jgi:hypothetical protein
VTVAAALEEREAAVRDADAERAGATVAVAVLRCP